MRVIIVIRTEHRKLLPVALCPFIFTDWGHHCYVSILHSNIECTTGSCTTACIVFNFSVKECLQKSFRAQRRREQELFLPVTSTAAVAVIKSMKRVNMMANCRWQLCYYDTKWGTQYSQRCSLLTELYTRSTRDACSGRTRGPQQSSPAAL